MTSANPLVVGAVDTATPFSGTGLLESGTDLVNAIQSGNWVEGGMAAFGVVMDTVAAVLDPLGSLIGAGLGWLIDHFEPLKGWFNDLTGDAGEVAAFAQTWANVQAQLQAAGEELLRILGDVDTLHGEAMDAYRRFQHGAAEHLTGAASWAGAMSTGLQIASTIVQIVHDLVRDVISQLVGSVISWAATAVFSLGLATPWIVSQVATRVASLTATVGESVTALLRSTKNLAGLLDQLKALLKQADDLFERVLRGGGEAPAPRLADTGRPLQGGGQIRPRNVPDGGYEWAEAAYDGFRASDDDLSAMLQHPENFDLPNGHRLRPDELAQIKQHIMEDEHLLNDYAGGAYPSRFDADPSMAEAWYRMMRGEAVGTDRVLLLHELTESNFLRNNPGATYEQAHAAADAVANWKQAIGT